MAQEQPIVSTRELTVDYGDLRVLDAVDFECSSGDFVAIVGRSGTGKTSFLNALAGLIPFDGQVAVSGQMGYVFQNRSLFPWLTVEQNIAFGLPGGSREEKRKRVDEVLDKIGLPGLGARYPNQLSGGQVQRVALARALAPDPEILLMDEPYGALDHLTREKMQAWLLSVWQETRKTVLFVTHYIEEAIFLADRIVVVRDGRFVSDLAVPFSRPRHDDCRYMERFLDVKHEIIDYMGISS